MKKLLDNENVDFAKQKGASVAIPSDEDINQKYIKGDVRIITEQARYPLNTIVSMVNSSAYKLNPEFQRRHRWNVNKKSKLIESIIINVPIPPIFLYEIDYSVYEVMDGLQRMTAISQFYNNEYALINLEEWPELNGKYYKDLPEQIKKGIDRRYLSSIILLQETAKDAQEAQRLKQLVFERINSGGEKLTGQETRNALYPGPLNELCIRLGRHPSFCKMFSIPEPDLQEISGSDIRQEVIENKMYSKMEDTELVLRFFAYRQIEKWESRTLENFLDIFLKQGNTFGKGVLDEYERIFKETCDLLYAIYEEKAFWLFRERNGNWIHSIRPTKVLYDPMMYVLSDLLSVKEKLLVKKAQIVEQTEELHKQHKETLGGRNTDKSDVLVRVKILNAFFAKILIDE